MTNAGAKTWRGGLCICVRHRVLSPLCGLSTFPSARTPHHNFFRTLNAIAPWIAPWIGLDNNANVVQSPFHAAVQPTLRSDRPLVFCCRRGWRSKTSLFPGLHAGSKPRACSTLNELPHRVASQPARLTWGGHGEPPAVMRPPA